MSDAIAQAIAAAQAAKDATQAAQAPSGSNVPAVAANTGGAVSTHVKAPKLNMETVSAGSMSVDAWLKPKEFGLLVGDNKELFKKCVCSIDMTDGKGFVVKKGIKAGNPARYWYTTDGVTCVSGGSWEAAVAQAKAISPNAYEYRCVDLPFTLLEDIVVDGKVLAKAGMSLGYTTSTTNWKNWESFYRDCADKNHLDEVVKVNIGFESKSNKAGNNWGVMTFDLVGSLAEEMAEAE